MPACLAGEKFSGLHVRVCRVVASVVVFGSDRRDRSTSESAIHNPQSERDGLRSSILANRGFQKTEELRDQGIGIVFSPRCSDRPFGCAVGDSMTPYPFKTVVGKGFGNHGNAKAGTGQGQNRGYFGNFLNNPGTKAVSGTQLQNVPVELKVELRCEEMKTNG